MLYEAFLEIRNLTGVGLCEQANALAGAFHNIPISLFALNFDWDSTRMYIGSYQRQYPRIVENNIVSGSYNDYLSMLDEIEKLGDQRNLSA